MALFEKMPAWPDRVDHFLCQGQLLHVYSPQHPVDALDDLPVQYKPLLAHRQGSLHCAGIEYLVHPAQGRHGEHQGFFVTGLEVEDFGVSGRGSTPAGDPVGVGDLGAGNIDQAHLHGADGDASHPHIHDRTTGTVPNRISRIGQLDYGDAADHVGGLLSQESGKGHGGGRAGLGLRGYIDGKPVAGILQGAFHLLLVVEKGSHGVVRSKGVGFFLQGIFAPGDHRHHAQAVFGHDPFPGSRLDGLGGVAYRFKITIDVGRPDRHPLDLGHDRPGVKQMVAGKRIGQLHQIRHILKVGTVGFPAFVVEAVQPTDHRLDVQRFGGHFDVVFGIAGVDRKRRWGLAQSFLHDGRGDPTDHRLFVHLGPGFAQQLQSLACFDLHTGIPEDGQCGFFDLFDLFLR